MTTSVLSPLKNPVRLSEGPDMDYVYVPIAMGKDFRTVVDPHDHDMMESISLAAIALGRQTATVSKTPDDDDDDDLETAREKEKIRFQVTCSPKERLYRMTFSYPADTPISLYKVNEIYSLFPNRIIPEEISVQYSENLRSQLLRLCVTTHGTSFYSRADIIFYHKEPRVHVTHIFSDEKGAEGQGVKRQREGDDTGTGDRSVRAKKDHIK